MIQTKITEMFDIEYPIICGAMMWICKPELCAAISNAGGMGNITAAIYKTEEEFRGALRKTRELTDKPFTVNITLLPSINITPEHHKMYLTVCAEEKVPALEISGAPIDKACGMEYIDMLKKAGVKLFHKVGSVRHAMHAEKAGYDGIFAAGIEEGGHPLNDDVTTMLLTPRIVESVNIPVVTTGGIANGKTMAAALMLGADAVMMASRFMATRECDIHQNIKDELVKRQERDTTLICKSVNLQGRALINETTNAVLDVESKGGGLEKIIPLITGDKCLKAWETGDVDVAPMMVGQSIGLIHEVTTCKELLASMAAEAEAEISKLHGKLIA
ncbi:NAD(P)H-dependent flavin oxidoreductase [Desulfoluna butyratoxydans]|uniref:Nitronate monooxygenase n=1 Tax=Desulfoluna butyratoxydans TaxID=231438 RepID=A0A4U8YJT1_9BACT|nr:nitronate monooxygenase [Desulfoluna butyratoxydans]VFQ44046.1 nitronate monooxygenase [Desulfoluna butyratoxydans]